MSLKGKEKQEYMRLYWKQYWIKFPEKLRLKRMKDNKRITAIFSRYKRRAVVKKYSFELSFDEFKKITFEPCFYCGEYMEPQNGIDRKDNSLGYTLINSVSCCGMCNQMKNVYPITVFLEKCKKIVENRERLDIN